MSLSSGMLCFLTFFSEFLTHILKWRYETVAKPTNFLVLGIDLSKTVEAWAENQSAWGTTQYLNSFN